METGLQSRIDAITKEEYFKLKKSQRITRIVGILLFVCSLPLYILFVMMNMPFLVAPFGCVLVAGPILFMISFTHQKYAVLKYVKFDKKEMKAVSEITSEITQDNTNENENNRILGCLLGGAAGDALGYAVEFLRYDDITDKYGKNGITSYSIDSVTGKAIISDDTQMTLFTAEGILDNSGDDDVTNIYLSYLNWLLTQKTSFEERPTDSTSKLLNYKELFCTRAPGNTCLMALSSEIMGTVTNPINSSKGCGGVMRVAPIAFINYYDVLKLDKLAAQAAAITHGHPLGYLPAGLLVHIVHTAIYENAAKKSLVQIITESISRFSAYFSDAPYLDDLLNIVSKAIELSGNNKSDIENITELGEGWVAEETLAIAVYCALRYQNDFSKAMVAAVNHNGDSDSTGAVTGNILGAYLGENKIENKWKENLELYDLILEIASDFQS